jgi:uncharacterized membrane protein
MADVVVPATPAVPPPPPQKDHSTLKEWVTAVLALIVVIGAFILTAYAAQKALGDFAKIKDLLLFINPILGVVIGYYFSKTATENVVNRAEAAADRANAQATTAVADKARAETTTNQMRSAVTDLVSAAKAQLQPETRTLSMENGGDGGATILTDAIKRAEMFIR